MYHISKLSSESMSFMNKVLASNGGQKLAFCLALGYVLSRELSLPTQEVDDIVSYYRLHHQNALENKLGRINELMVCDTRAVRQFAQAMYQYRYSQSTPPLLPLAVRVGNGVKDFFSLSRFFSEDELGEINNNSITISQYIAGLSKMLVELYTSNEPIEEQGDLHVA